MSLTGCLAGYKPALKDPVNVCLDGACPISGDLSLDACIGSCSNNSDCRVFNHTNIGQTSKCFLFGYDDKKGHAESDVCGKRVGYSCCEKVEFLVGCSSIHFLAISYFWPHKKFSLQLLTYIFQTSNHVVQMVRW